MSLSLATLKKLTLDELIVEHDKSAAHTMVGVQYYLDEIRDRSQSEFADRMEALTKQMKLFTIVATAATVISVVLTAWALFKI
jgi:hypothetical protein